MSSFIGLDLGTHTLKAVQLKDLSGKKILEAYAFSPSPEVSMESESDVDISAYGSYLSQFISENPFTTRRVVISLPESQIFTRVVSLPLMDEKELDSAVKFEAEQLVPRPLSEVNLSYQNLGPSKDATKQDVLLVAAPQTLVQKYMKILGSANLVPLSIETETVSIGRAINFGGTDLPPTLVTALGASRTDIAIFSKNALRFTRSISTGGDALARAISQNFGFELSQAEEYKKSYGLEESQLEGKVMKVIKPVFDVIVEEVKRSLAFYATHFGEDIKRVVLAGGTANLPGISVYLAAALGVEVIKGNPWENLEVPDRFPKEELEEIAPSFMIAAGLAMKEL